MGEVLLASLMGETSQTVSGGPELFPIMPGWCFHARPPQRGGSGLAVPRSSRDPPGSAWGNRVVSELTLKLTLPPVQFPSL